MTRFGARRWLDILEATWAEIGADRVSIVASGVAFRVALALFPAVALMMWAASRTVGPDEAKALVGTLADLLPDASRSVVGQAVGVALRNDPVDAVGEAPRLGALAPVFGFALALWSTNSGMGALFAALNIVYDKEESRLFMRRNLVTLAFTLGALGLLALSAGALLATPALLSLIGLGDAAADAVRWGRWPALFAGFAVGLALLYRYAPNRQRERWPPVTVGSTLAAGSLVLGTALFSWFARRFLSLGASYGSLSTVMAFLLWLWASFFAILACAELDSEIERLTGLYGAATGRDRD